MNSRSGSLRSSGMWVAALAALVAIGEGGPAAAETTCTSDVECGALEVCYLDTCGTGVCVPAFHMTNFVIGEPVTPYTAPVTSVLDHTDAFYQRCCDTNITAYTGESADRDENAVFCPEEPNFPACFFATCLCGFQQESGEDFVVNGTYSSPFGPQYLYYAGHPGYDYTYGFDVPIVTPLDGMLCKALDDFINGHFGFPTAWDRFHTFYVDHGIFAGQGWSTWYLHASDLEGTDTLGNPLADLEPGECAPVAAGQTVALVGNQGTIIPHLHFEVRRYAASEDPEAPSAKIIDPYGWSGEGADPWTDISENSQAASQIAPLWIGCGNGRVECGEDCDDANLVNGDGCSSLCSEEAPSVPAMPPEGMVILLVALALAGVLALRARASA